MPEHAIPHAPGVSQAATGPLSASPPKETPMARHTPDKPQDVVTALRDDLTHALGSGRLADLALRAVEPALLAVEVDTAQRMQGGVDRERRRAEAWEADARRYAGNADYWRERAEAAEADLAAAGEVHAALIRERDAFRFRAEAAEEAARLDEQRADRAEQERDDARAALTAMLPAHERQLREQIARDIEETADADVIGPYEAGLDRAARVARGERLPGAPAPTLDDLARRAAGIALPSEPADILAALLRIGGDLARAYEPGQRADMERELGNLVVSSLRWMRAYGLAPLTCIETAERVQRERAEREGR